MENGIIVGYYSDANGLSHGFVRAADGTITPFDAPGAGAASGQGTSLTGIAFKGEAVGQFIDPNNVRHGVLLHVNGSTVTLSAPNASDTYASSINVGGAVAGSCVVNGVQEGYVWTP